MKLLRSRLGRIVVTPLFIVGILVAQFAHVPFAHATSSDTWTGGGSDNKFSTIGNWDNGVPGAGTIVVFPNLGLHSYTLNNDLSVALGGVIYGVGGDHSTRTSYTINTFHLNNGATISDQKSYGSEILISDSVVADGSLVFIGTTNPFIASAHDVVVSLTDLYVGGAPIACGGVGYDYAMKWNPTGTIGIDTGSEYAITTDSTASQISVADGALLQINAGTSPAYAGHVIVQGGPVTIDNCGDAVNYSITSFGNVTLSGTVDVVDADAYYDIVNADETLTLTGTLTGGQYGLKADPSSLGTLVNNTTTNTSSTPSGSQNVAMTVLPALTDDQPTTNLTVAPNTTISLDGSRKDVFVSVGGVLKGTGTASSVVVAGTIAPGHSPGTMTIPDTASISGTYQAEILNKDSYDQLIVGANHSADSTQAIFLSGAKLDTVLYSGWKINKGDAFTIIDNKSTQPVNGTFAGLPEGTQFTVSGIVFSITYTGGTGNDIVLTAINSGTDPKAPNTAVMQFVKANPGIIVGLGIITAGFLLIASRRRATK